MKSGSDKMPRRTHLLALEPRMMFDAAAGAVVQNAVLSNGDAAHGASTDHAAAFAHGADAGFHDTHMIVPDGIGAAARSATPAAATTAPHDVIFIDTAVADYQQLVSEWSGKGEIVLIDSTKDGIDQMRAALAGDSNVAAIHIVSHGEEGVLFLGTTRIDEATIEGDLSGSLAAIGRSLAPGGDILLYGCDFAEGADGARALAAFAQATHADVAASTDLTGYAGKGGDWVLEAHDGAIQAHTLSSDDWAHTLDPNVFVPIAVTPDSLTVTDASGKVITTGTTGYVTNSKADTTQRSANVGAGAVARWNDAATLADGTKVDLLATVVSISNGDFVQFNRPTSAANGDDPTFLLRDASNGNATNGDGANVQILWQLVVSGTTTPIAANVEFGILDIDGVGGKPNSREAVSVATDNLAYYTAESATDIAITPSLSQIQASGTQNENTDSTKPLDTKSEVTFDWTKVSAFTINYSLAKNNGFTTQAQFYQDGNADFKYSNPVYVSVPRLDLDANDSTAPGNDAHFVATAGQGDSAIVDSDVVVSNPMDVNSVQGATVTLTNAMAGDALHVGTLPSNITATVTNGNGTISVSLSGTGSQTDYDTALRAVTFANTLASPDTTQRVIDVAFTNGTLTSATAVSRIDINHAPVANPDSASIPEEATRTIAVLANDTDADGDPLTVTSASAQNGTVTINTDGTLSYTSNALYRGTDTITYTIADGRGGTATSTVAVTVTPVNHAPQDVGTLPSQASQDAATVSYQTANAFHDPDGDTLSYSATGLPTGLSIDPASGIISGTIDHSASQVNGGSYAIAVTATDPSNASATQNFTLSVTNPPPVAHNDTAAVHVNTAKTIAVLTNDVDPDGDALTVTSASAQHGSVVINSDGTITYTPNTGYAGSDTIPYTISDGQGGTSNAVVNVTVGNAAPTNTAFASQSANDGQSVSLPTASHFSDADGDTLTYTATGLPTGLSIDPSTGVISGTIDRSASQVNGGAYDSTVTANDGHGGTDAAPLHWQIANPPPVARGDTATTPEEVATTIAVLSNDSDPDGDPLSVASASAQHGSVTINPDNTITYTPNALYRGSDSIAYTISDGQGGTSSAHVAVTVTPVNHAPQDVGTLPAQTSQDAASVSYATAGAFSDPDGDTLTYTATGLPKGLSIDPSSGIISGTIDHSASQVNGGSYAVAVTATDPSNASATQTFTLSVTNPPPVAHDDTATTPEEAAATIAVLANDVDPDGDALTVTSATAQHGSVVINGDNTITYTPNALYRGSDSIAYAISDGQGGTSSAHVAVTVTPVNHPPQDVAIPANYGSADSTAVNVSITGAFTDPDGDTLTYGATGLPAGLSIDPVAGVISGTIDRSASQVNGGVYAVTLTATDPSNTSAAQHVTLSVTNPPPVAQDDSATTPEEVATTITVLANDHDPDGDPLTVTSATAQHGSVAINPDGTITYTPNALYRGTDSIAYAISDGQGGTSSAHVAVTVTPVNHAPQDVGTLPPQASQDAATVSYPTAGAFHDPDGDTLTYSAANLPQGLSIDPSTGVISGTIDRSASQVNGGVYSVAVTATDPSNASATQGFTLSVTNPPPVAVDDSASTHVDTARTIAVLANDHDPDGDPLTVTGATPQSGTAVVNPDGTITYTPAHGFTGTDTIAYTISDGQGGTANAVVTVTIGNAAPTNMPLGVQSANDGQTVSLPVASSFSDADGDTLTYSATDLPAGLSIDPATGIISGTIDRSASQVNGGAYKTVITADDGHGGTDAARLRWQIANPPPVAHDDSATTREEAATTIAVLANDVDPDGDPLTVTSATAQHGSVAINPDGTITYTPDALYRGTDSIAYSITDGQGGTSSAQVAVTVTPVNHAPQDVGTLPSQASQDAATVSYQTASAFNDPDGDTLTYAATGLPAGLSIDPASGIISGTIDHSASQSNGGSYAIVVEATDPSNASTTQSFALSVTNLPPVAYDDRATVHVDTPASIAVLANDVDSDGDALTVTGASAQHGAVVVNADGTITYTPATGFSGSDVIAYSISDGQGGISNAVVDVTVGNTPPIDTPFAAQSASDGQTVSLPLASHFSDADGDPLTYTATGLPAGLSIDLATGIVSGTIDRSASQVNGGAYDSVVTANDGHGGTDAATLHWQVANPAPTAQDDSATTPEETPVVIAILANDHDPDGDPLTVTSASAQHGSVAINPDGTVTYTPDALYRGADSIAYTIGDGQGGTSAAHVAVTVTPVDHAPVAQTIATQSAADAQSVMLDVSGFFADPDGDRLTYSATGLPPGVTIDPATGRIAGTLDHSASRGSVYHVVVTATDPSNAKASSGFDWTIVNPAPVAADDTATVPEDGHTIVAVLANDHDPDGDPLTVTTATAQHGSVTINPDNTLTYTPGPYYRGNDVIVYTIADGDGGTASASVMVTVTPVNHAPTATDPLTGQSAVEGSNVAISAAPLFHDVDGDALTYAATGLPKGLSIDPASGTITGTVDREAASQAPGGTYTVSVTATDPSGLGAVSTFALAVTNPPPMIADSSAHTPEDTGIVLPALANARDPDGDPMTVTAASADHGSVTINPDGTVAYRPGASFSGADIVRYTVTDADGASATATVSVTVDHVNHPPVVPTQGDPIAAVGGRPVQIDALAGVTDPDGDGATIVQASSANGRVAVNPDGTLVFTPDLGFAGTTTIRYMVADGNGGFTEGVYVVRVADGRGADINELLEIGRVKFVDPSPGFVNIVVPDGVVRTPLTILDTVEAVRSLNTTVIGRQPVGDAVEAIRTLDGTYVDPAHPVLGEVARLDSLRDQRDAGDRLFDHRWGDFLVKGMTGFSVANDRAACVTVESVVRGGAIYVEVRDTAGEGTSPIRSVDIRPASGGVPDWIKVDHRGLAIVERAADMDELHLIVRVIRANGHTSTTPIVIQGATGEIELDRQHNAPAGHHRAAPLDATLYTHHAATRAHAAHIDRIFK